MAERIAVDFDVLSAHAARIRTVADEVDQAQSAASSINLGGGAFGIMCMFMVPPVSIASGFAVNALQAAAGMISRSADGI